MAISKEQWAEIETRLTGIYGCVDLLCDGYKVGARVELSKMKLVVTVYVDGYIKGEWIFNDSDSEIPRKFHQEKKRFISSTKMRAWYTTQSKSTKLWTKEERHEYAEAAKKTSSHWWPHWPSANAFCRHIRKTCTSIEIVKIGY